MNDRKICFIACTNNVLMMSECIEYINRLYVPEGYEIDLITVSDAKSMTSGYNEAMKNTDARYKVYLHQDVFITNRYFLYDVLDIFNSDKSIGLIGMVGYPMVSQNGVMWYERRVGAVPMYGAGEHYKDVSFEKYRYSIDEGYTDAAVVDGLMIVTSQDIGWDEDFDGWDFYDATISLRFREKGLRVVVPFQRVPWFVHDDGSYLSVWNYNKYRHLFLAKYADAIDKVNFGVLKRTNDKKIAFILCVNNDTYCDECIWYLSKIVIPGYEIQVFPIRGAESIAEGYETAMKQTDAKYKIYLHQDVFITDSSLVSRFIDIFKKNEDIGMLGVLGSDEIYQDAFFWNRWNLGQTYVVTPERIKEFRAEHSEERLYNAKAIDGMIMATQYDIPWRTDLGLKWDYYDISHSIEYIRRGFRIGVLGMKKSMTIHDCGVTNIKNIDYSRKLFVKAYPEMNFHYAPDEWYNAASTMSEKSEAMLKSWMDNQDYEKISEFIVQLEKKGGYTLSTNGRLIILFTEIYKEEEQRGLVHSFIGKMDSFEAMKSALVRMTFDVRRLLFDKTNEKIVATNKMSEKNISKAALDRIYQRALPE